MSDFPLYAVRNLRKSVPGPKDTVCILDSINLDIAPKDTLSIVGASGSGKTTLLHLLGGLDLPTAGQILFHGQDIATYSWAELTEFRNATIGFVFQFHYLLPEFTTLENVAMPGLIHAPNRSKIMDRARDLLNLVGLGHMEKQSVSTLSGGERQLAAIARALLMRPEVVLADEPTGNLDAANGEHVGDLLVNLNKELSTTLVVVTHNLALAGKMHRQIHLRAGALYENSIASSQ